MELTSDPPVYETPLQEVISNHYSALYPLYNVMTPAFDSSQVDQVRLGIFLDGAKQKALPGFQFSDDGVTWDSPTILGIYNATQGWYFQTAYTSSFSYSPKNFIRFGMALLNATTSDTKNRTGQAKLSIQFKPLFGQTVAGGPRKVNSKGSTSDGAFHVITGAVPTASFDEIRRTLVLATSSGDIQLEAAYQVTNTPDDETSWDTAVTFGSAVLTETIDFAGTFSSVSLTKKWARFGVLVKNINGSSALEACRATLRVDLRYGA